MSKPTPLHVEADPADSPQDRQQSSGPQSATDMANMNTPLHNFTTDIRTELEAFRDNWQRELKGQSETATRTTTSHTPTPVPSGEERKATSNEALELGNNNVVKLIKENDQQNLAEQLFRSAVELEQRGKVYDALPLYRKAVQIVPDIEFKFYEQQKLKAANHAENMKIYESAPIMARSTIGENESTVDVDAEELIEDLYEKFQLDLASDGGRLLYSSRDASVISTETHISALPPEILLYILRWVVSSQLDMQSLERCAAVCKGLYLCARDEELWRLACAKVWGANHGSLGEPLTQIQDNINVTDAADSTTPIAYTSWREMFILRERVLYNGCYISKTTYLRMGENSFQDQYYRPVQLVEYYRYARFLGDGRVLMMTNADEPTQGVNKLKNIHQLRAEVLCGHYRLCGDIITILLKKQQPQQQQQHYSRFRRGSLATVGAAAEEPNCTKYCIEFRITNTTKRKYARLVWLSYTVVQRRNKVETSSEFELTPSKYPPLWFSPVRSYHLDTDAPLT